MSPAPPRPSRGVTIYDVAARANVSAKTVTNVVHERQNVRPATRQRVLEAIAELGYRPVIAGRQLRQRRSDTLTLVIPDVVNPYFAALIDAVFRAAHQRGYAVFVEHTGVGPGHEREATSSMLRFAFDGVLFSPSYTTPEELAELAQRLPIVLLGENVQGASLDLVSIDNVAAATDVTQHLITTGRRRVAFLGDRSRLPEGPVEPGGVRLRGYRAALSAAGLEPLPLIGVEEYDLETGDLAAARLLAERPDLDAIVCANDLLALGVMHRLRQAGVRVPDDVAVTGWDNIPQAAYCAPTLTTVEPHVDDIADAAVARLLARIEGSRTPAERLVVPHDVVPRESSAARTRT